MFSAKSLAAFSALFATLVARAQAGDVYAHFIVGNAGSYSQSDWAKDIAAAAESKIDGFALNIGGDSYTGTQLGNAYAAAEAHGNFKMFISFDYAANPSFSASQVQSTINQYKSSSAQATYQNKPIVSTFEGPSAAGDWTGIKANTGCFFVPDWTSAKGNPSTFGVVDGALSWDIWPTGADDMTTAGDKAWQSLLGSKVYMMGVSPWFYTDLPQYNKNWLWRGNQLWYERWQQAIELQPELIEIVTWNDFGESHYIGPIVQSEIVNGAQRYINNNPHDGWRALLPYYIEAYKNGNKTAAPTQDILSWAHQPNPGKSCPSGGTTGGQDGSAAVTAVAEDAIDVDVLLTAPADVSVTIGGGQPQKKSAVGAGITHFQFPFNGQTGQVVYTVSRNGKTVMTVQGTQITTDCPGGTVNWNAVTGSSTGASSGAVPAGSSNSTNPTSNPTSNSSSSPSPSSSAGLTAGSSAASSASPASSSVAPAVSQPQGSSTPSQGSGKGSSGGKGSSSVSGSSACSVQFDVKDTTQWGEEVFVAGNQQALGNWATDKALALSANSYSASNPVWTGSASIPAGSSIDYKYFKKEVNGSIVWESGANRTMTVPSSCSSPITQNDSVA